MLKAVFVTDIPYRLLEVYAPRVLKELKNTVDLYDTIVTSENVGEHLKALEEADFLFSTWGVPVFPEEIIDKMKNLKCFFYAASSVRRFAQPYMQRGVKIVNAGKANGDFVAKWAFSLIYLSLKGFFTNLRIGDDFKGEAVFENTTRFGSTDRTVGIIGAGNIGKEVIKMLLPNEIHVLVYDPYLSEEAAEKMGVKKASLEEIFSKCLVISNHAPAIDSTDRMITKKHFELMQSGATFINSGRGTTIVEEGMCEVLAKRKDIAAIVDVVVEKNPPEESPLNRLNNLFRTPHIAGANGTEESELAMSLVRELKRYLNGEPLTAEITPEIYERMG